MRLLFPAVIAASLLLGGCKKKEAVVPPPPEPPHVKTALAREQTVQRSISVTGALFPDDTVTLSSEASGRIIKINYDFGQPVSKGAVVVELDPTEYRLQMERAKGALNQSLARLGLGAYSGNMAAPETTPALRQVMAQAEDAKFKFDSAAKLVKTGDISQERFTEMEKSYRARQAAVDAARDEVRTGYMNVTALEADYKIAEKHLRDTQVRAPYDGIVGDRLAAVGQYVKDNVQLIKLVKVNPLRLRLEVPEVASAPVRPGTTLTFSTDALPGREFQAVVREINPTLDARNRTLTAEARLVKGDPRLRPGMFVQVRLTTNPNLKIVTIPKNAVYSIAGLTKAFVIRNGVARQITFTPGIEVDGGVEVPGGVIADGDPVAVSELATLINGMKVRG